MDLEFMIFYSLSHPENSNVSTHVNVGRFPEMAQHICNAQFPCGVNIHIMTVFRMWQRIKCIFLFNLIAMITWMTTKLVIFCFFSLCLTEIQVTKKSFNKNTVTITVFFLLVAAIKLFLSVVLRSNEGFWLNWFCWMKQNTHAGFIAIQARKNGPA